MVEERKGEDMAERRKAKTRRGEEMCGGGNGGDGDEMVEEAWRAGGEAMVEQSRSEAQARWKRRDGSVEERRWWKRGGEEMVVETR